MKDLTRIGYFVGLKAVEIGTIIFVPYGIGNLVHRFTCFFCIEKEGVIAHANAWGIGIGVLCISFVSIILSLAVVLFVVKNWEWADDLREYWRMRKYR